MNIEHNLREHWPYRSEGITDKQRKALRSTIIHLQSRLDYLQQVSYIEHVLNEPVTFRHFEETIKAIGLIPCYTSHTHKCEPPKAEQG